MTNQNNAAEAAAQILTYLGFAQAVSMEHGADRRRDHIQALIESAAALSSRRAPLADERNSRQIAHWKRSSELLDAVQDGCWDVRFLSSSNGDAGDFNIGIEIVAHFMEAPRERVIGENWNENLRAALEQAVTAEAYPPAGPERPAPAAGDALDALVNKLAGIAYQYAVTLDQATRDADSDELQEIARRITDILKDTMRASIVAHQGEG